MADNLLFIQAVAALNDALEYLRDAEEIDCSSNNFYSLLLQCQRKWPHGIDYRRLHEIRERRNALNHDGQLIDSCDCWESVDVIAQTLDLLNCLPYGAKVLNVLAPEDASAEQTVSRRHQQRCHGSEEND
jgi:hypothetical protein